MSASTQPNLQILSLAAAVQNELSGGSALADGTRVLELPAQFYFQRHAVAPYVSGGSGPGTALTDTAYQFFHPQFQFVLRSVQYQSSGPYKVIFSNGRVLKLPQLGTVVGTGTTGRLDVSGTCSQDSAGGIPIDPCDRVTLSGTGFKSNAVLGIFTLDASILFIGVLRIFLRGGEVQAPYPGYPITPRALFTANQNLFSPETRRGWQCYPETPAGFRDEIFWVACPPVTVVVANQGASIVSGQALLPGDSDFVWREWDFTIPYQDPTFTSLPDPALLPVVRFRTQAGESVSEDLVDCRACQGPVFPETVLPAGSYVSYDVSVQGITGGSGDVVVQLYLFGVRRFRK